MSNDTTTNVKTKNNRVNKMTKLHSIHLEFTLQFYHTYPLLYCKGHIQIMSNDTTPNVKTKTIE